ncbi:unnamed protein product [Musa hybrid cultivar]
MQPVAQGQRQLGVNPVVALTKRVHSISEHVCIRSPLFTTSIICIPQPPSTTIQIALPFYH